MSTLQAEGVASTLAADAAIHRNYAELVREAVDNLTGQAITAEDIRAWIAEHHPGARPHHPNVLPAAMKYLVERGRLTPAGWCEASRSSARGRVLRVWRVSTNRRTP